MQSSDIKWNDKILAVKEPEFESLALEIFRFQYNNNPVYRDYSLAIGRNLETVNYLKDIPYLPVRFFQSHRISSCLTEPEVVFESSGTTRSMKSRHYVADLSLYEAVSLKGFELFYGSIGDYCILGLLPSYLERKNASLVYMVQNWITLSKDPRSGFYLDELEKLLKVIGELRQSGKMILLIGVTFALLNLAEKKGDYPGQFYPALTIMETGGMKGRKTEMVRPAVHAILEKAFLKEMIHSEYGMTELLSQAYSKGEGIFHCPPWMKVVIRDTEVPLEILSAERPEGGRINPVTGAINVIDLANVYSCSFIATDDIGWQHPDGSFEVMGRLDGSDLRGCSLMVGPLSPKGEGPLSPKGGT